MFLIFRVAMWLSCSERLPLAFKERAGMTEEASEKSTQVASSSQDMVASIRVRTSIRGPSKSLASHKRNSSKLALRKAFQHLQLVPLPQEAQFQHQESAAEPNIPPLAHLSLQHQTKEEPGIQPPPSADQLETKDTNQ